MYEEIKQQALALWSEGRLDEAISFVQGHVTGTVGELRGRLLSLCGEFMLNAERKSEAFEAQVEALSLVTNAAHRVIVLVAAINVCVPFMRLSQGLRYADECHALLLSPTYNDVDCWKAKFHRNVGELLMRAGDYEAASTHLREAVGEFEKGGQHQPALRSQVDLAECLMMAGELETALSICRGVRLDTACEYVLDKLEVVQSRVAARLGRIAEAERGIDRAYVGIYGKLDSQDRRLIKSLELAKVEVAVAKGDVAGTNSLQHCADRIIAAIEASYGF